MESPTEEQIHKAIKASNDEQKALVHRADELNETHAEEVQRKMREANPQLEPNNTEQ